jgi:hypothetical protein
MIITLTGANFSANNIGTLSTWTISRVLGDGATYSGDTYVDKGAALNATVTIASGYELGSAGVTVTMGGNAVTSGITTSGNTITIKINAVTGNVVIKVPTKNTATGEEGGGNEEPVVPVTTTFFGTDVTIVSDPSELNYVAGKMAGTGASGFGDKVGRACSITQCLEVSGGSTVVLNQVIDGVTLKYSIREFSALPLSADTKTTNGQDAAAWLTANQKLQSATKYIVICANRNTETNFNASELELLKQAFTIS